MSYKTIKCDFCNGLLGIRMKWCSSDVIVCSYCGEYIDLHEKKKRCPICKKEMIIGVTRTKKYYICQICKQIQEILTDDEKFWRWKENIAINKYIEKQNDNNKK